MKFLEKNIDFLDLDDNVCEVLNNNNIYKVCDLFVLSRKELKCFGLSDSVINKIRIKLQLIGFDLNGKKY